MKCPDKPRFEGDLTGCGSTNVTEPDDEGLCDCIDCGMWFDPKREPERKEMINVKVGDTVTRVLTGIPMQLKVTGVTDTHIHCGPYIFDRVTGGEIDEDLGWTAQETGSYLKREEE